MNESKEFLLWAALIFICVGAFYLGRETARAPASAAVISNQFENVATHEVIKTVVSKAPDGSPVTTVTKDIVINDSKRDQTVSVSTAADRPKVNVSALVSYDFSGSHPIYGVSANKEFIGHMTIGAFGLTNGTAGLSVGWNF